MAKYVVNKGTLNRDPIYLPFYNETVDVDFPSPRHKPVPLTPTGGLLQITKRNAARVGATYAFNMLRDPIVIEQPGSDSGLVNNALANLSGSSIDLLVSLMELPQALEMLANAANAAYRAIKEFRKGNLIGGIKALGQTENMSRRLRGKLNRATKLEKRTAEDTFLEYQFGWMPFFSDIKGGLEALNATFEKGKTLKRRSSNVQQTKAERELQRSQIGLSPRGESGFRANTTISISGQVQNSELAALNSLGFVNAAQGMWNITPYSFVVDYFVGVNDWLGALTGKAGLTNVNAVKTTTTITKANVSGTSTVSFEIITIYRSVIWATPTFPGLKLAGFTGEKMANITALLVQSEKRR